jgi:hypothetical protein
MGLVSPDTQSAHVLRVTTQTEGRLGRLPILHGTVTERGHTRAASSNHTKIRTDWANKSNPAWIWPNSVQRRNKLRLGIP